jgi:hypothetical protein
MVGAGSTSMRLVISRVEESEELSRSLLDMVTMGRIWKTLITFTMESKPFVIDYGYKHLRADLQFFSITFI